MFIEANKLRVQPAQFNARLVGRKLPVDLGSADVSVAFPGGDLIREDSVRRVSARSNGNRRELSAPAVGLSWLADVPPAFWSDLSLVLSLRAEVESLREEVRQLREEMEFWKAESHKHFCDAQYWQTMHQQALERIAQRLGVDPMCLVEDHQQAAIGLAGLAEFF